MWSGRLSSCGKDSFMVSESAFFFGLKLLDWEMRVLWYSQTAKSSICIHKSRYGKMDSNIVKYRLGMEREVGLRELPNSSKYVI